MRWGELGERNKQAVWPSLSSPGSLNCYLSLGPALNIWRAAPARALPGLGRPRVPAPEPRRAHVLGRAEARPGVFAPGRCGGWRGEGTAGPWHWVSPWAAALPGGAFCGVLGPGLVSSSSSTTSSSLSSSSSSSSPLLSFLLPSPPFSLSFPSPSSSSSSSSFSSPLPPAFQRLNVLTLSVVSVGS